MNEAAGALAEESLILSDCVQVANDELMRYLSKHPEALFDVHPGTFEQIIAEIFRDQGFEVELLGSWNQADGGIDIIAVQKSTLIGDFRVGIQCKRYVKTNKVGADAIYALEGRLNKFHLHKGVLATTAHIAKGALADLSQHLWRIELREFERIKQDLEAWGCFEGSKGLWLPYKSPRLYRDEE